MKKRMSRGGARHYVERGLKPITIFVPKDLHAKLTKIAQGEERSLQATVRRLLEQCGKVRQ